MTLYEIDSAILDCVDRETGEIVDIDKLNHLQMERDQKISNVACWLKDLKAEAEAVKAEKINLAKRQTACENKVDQLKKWLAYALDGNKYKDSRVSISYRKSTSVNFSEDFDINEIAENYVKVTKEPRKTEITEALKSGIDIAGCELVEKQNIQIR